MIINFRVKGFTLTQGGRKAVENKIESLNDLFNSDTLFDVFITKRDKDFKCEVKVQKGKDFIRCEETGETFEYSIDNVLSSLKKRVRKIKSMRITKKRGNEALSMKEAIRDLNSADEDISEVNLGIKRRKDIKLDVLTEEDAVMLLEALNHSFFIFANKDRQNAVCVLYRRDEGYGLLETDSI